METEFERLTDGQLVARLDVVLDALTGDRLGAPTDREQLDRLEILLRVGARVEALVQGWAAAVEATEAAWHEHKTSTTTWLMEALRLTPREGARLLKAGQGLQRFPLVGAAASAGELLASQAEAITSVLADLPPELPTEVVAKGEAHLVELAGSHNAVELRRLSRHLLEVLAPEVVEDYEAARLERELRAAMRHRFLEFHSDGRGSVRIRGSLPIGAAEAFIRIVDAHAAAEKRALDALDPYAEYISPAMRRADGLLAMVNQHCQQSLAPSHGGDRPRVVVTVSYDKLVKAATDAGWVSGELVNTSLAVSPSMVRQWLCDADLLPVVLGGASEVLDVGRTQRLVTPAIRAALELRDGGCVFPGCDKPPQACHAHHIIPWWAGGPTALWNLVLLCPHHHGIVEPGHDPSADRWKVRLRGDGIPEILPPRRVDAAQRPRLHARFLTPRRT